MTLSDFIEELNIAIRQDGHDIYCNASTAEIIKRCLMKQKEGEWIKQDCGGVEYTAVCSECGYRTFWSDASDFNFCPNCGFKMRR